MLLEAAIGIEPMNKGFAEVVPDWLGTPRAGSSIFCGRVSRPHHTYGSQKTKRDLAPFRLPKPTDYFGIGLQSSNPTILASIQKDK